MFENIISCLHMHTVSFLAGLIALAVTINTQPVALAYKIQLPVDLKVFYKMSH